MTGDRDSTPEGATKRKTQSNQGGREGGHPGIVAGGRQINREIPAGHETSRMAPAT